MARNHLADVQRGTVDKGNIIGIRKALNAIAYEGLGAPGRYHRSATAPQMTFEQADALLAAIHERKPLVSGELSTSGAKLLRDRRYRKRFNGKQSAIIASPHLRFRLVDFEQFDEWHYVPVYRAENSAGAYFDFRNIPWQSGGNGPQIVTE